MTHHHPTDFYVAHALFEVPRCGARHPEWAGLSDGPVDRDGMVEAIDGYFDRWKAPTLENLRVYWFQDDVPARDVTEDFILAWEAATEPTEDELLAQAACDRADDYAHEVAA